MAPIRAWMAKVRGPWKILATRHPRIAWTIFALSWLPMGIVFTESFNTVMVVSGRSMQPTLNPDDSKWRDVVLFDRYSVRIKHEFTRGDIVALKSPSDSKLIVKRIIALPGDTVKTLPPYPDAEVRIPDGRLWVEGDEPFHSEDSNTFGPVPQGLVHSRLDTILWPPSRFGQIVTPDLSSKSDTIRQLKQRGPAWRKEMDEVERAKRRQARVTVPPEQSS